MTDLSEPASGAGEALPAVSATVQTTINRRAALLGLPFAGAALGVATAVAADPAEATDRARMIAVIEALEAVQGWEMSCIAAAKVFAARQMRLALGLDLPEPEVAQMHVEFQQDAFARYQRTILHDRDIEAGKFHSISPMERQFV